jgi:uncharacterized protein HemX
VEQAELCFVYLRRPVKDNVKEGWTMKNQAILFLAAILVAGSLSACGSVQNRQLAQREQQLEDQAEQKKEAIEQKAEQQTEAIEQRAEQQQDAVDAELAKQKAALDKQHDASNESGGVLGGNRDADGKTNERMDQNRLDGNKDGQ